MSPQLNGQLDPQPRLRKRSGLGGLQFSDWNTPGSQFANSWTGIQNQIQAEGKQFGIDPSITASVVDVARSKMTDAVNQLSDSFDSSGAQADVANIITAATQYVKTGMTIVGAGVTMVGMVNKAKGFSTGKDDAAFMGSAIGTILSISVALGAISAGVGAAIGAVAAVFVALVEALVPDPTVAGSQVCSQFGGFVCQNPDYTVGCACFYGISVTGGSSSSGSVVTLPSSTLWRHFPDTTVETDKVWYNFQQADPNGIVTGNFRWKGLNVAVPADQNISYRPIDMAFAAFRQMECDLADPWPNQKGAVPDAVVEFNWAWQTAWRANMEFALNGLKVQDDYLILKHAIDLWNKSHAPGNPYTIVPAPDSTQLVPYPKIVTLNGQQSGVFTDCSSHKYTYIEILAKQIIQHSGTVILNTGPAYVVDDITGGQTIAKATVNGVAATAAVAAVGVIAYSQVAGITVGTALREIWSAVKSPVAKFLRGA